MIIIVIEVALTVAFFVVGFGCLLTSIELCHSDEDFNSLDKESDTYEETKTKWKQDNKKSNKWGIYSVIFLFLSLVSLVSIPVLTWADEKYATETTHIINATVIGKRSVIVNRGCGEDYYISCSDGKEYEVSGHSYSVIDKGDAVKITQHIVTGRISGDHYDWNDCEVNK